MKFTLSWLKDHLDTAADAEKIARALTAIGLEVERVEDHGAALAPFTVAEILHAEKHPNADKLKLCRVNDGEKERQIVCGAPNARAGIKVVLAREGVTIPTSGMVLKPTKIRGVESSGMLCSARELGLGDDHEGIMELPADAVVGAPIVPLLGLDDPMFEIALTPNRGDCLGVRGVARDLAAAGIGKLKPETRIRKPEIGKKSTRQITLETSACPFFVGVEIKGVKNGASPEWMQRRLKAIGLKPISALVDIGNYLTYDLGRPLHVYDAATLRGAITVRSAKAGEMLNALNQKTYELKPGMTVIADESSVLGLGGIIGGLASSCSDATTDILVEVALFNPVNIAQTGRELQIHTDARHRFERGVDPALVWEGASIAATQILEICGGELIGSAVAGEEPSWKRQLSFRPSCVKGLGGVDVPQEKIQAILEGLGFAGDGWKNESLSLTPPSWRPDIEGEADVVEEILRLHGYEHIPLTLLPKPERVVGNVLTLSQLRRKTVRTLLAARGMAECVTWAFTEETLARAMHPECQALLLENPIHAELSAMRPSLLANLLLAIKRNASRGVKDAAIFEVGARFLSVQNQAIAVAGLRAGAAVPRNLHGKARDADLFDAKADLFACLDALGMAAEGLPVNMEAPAWYHPGKSGAVMLGKTPVATFGELHPALLASLEIEGAVAAFELLPDALPEPRRKGTAKPALVLSEFQAVERDFAFIADDTLPAATLVKAIALADRALIRSVALFDVYRGKGVEEGKKSLAFAVTLQTDDRTLTEEEIEAASRKIVDAAAKVGATLRA